MKVAMLSALDFLIAKNVGKVMGLDCSPPGRAGASQNTAGSGYWKNKSIVHVYLGDWGKFNQTSYINNMISSGNKGDWKTRILHQDKPTGLFPREDGAFKISTHIFLPVPLVTRSSQLKVL